jgi:CBS domain-containing protein
MIRVKDLMTPQTQVISPDATSEEAASVMKTLGIGVLPVCDQEGLVGILTDGDLVARVLDAKGDPKTMLVGEVMTPTVVYCFEDDDVERSALVMAGQQLRRLPVLDRNRKLVGIISIGDIPVLGQSHPDGEVLEVSQQPGSTGSEQPSNHKEGLGQAA